jgi:hypothetical protein
MPEKTAIQRARADKRAGKSPSTQAGEFVKDEIDRVRAGQYGVRSAKQAIAIGLSKARRAGVDLKPPAKAGSGASSEATRKKAAQDVAAGQGRRNASGSAESKATRSRAAGRSATAKKAAQTRAARASGAKTARH